MLFLFAMVSLWVAAEEEKPQRVYWDIADQPEIVFHPDYRRAGASITFYNGDLSRMRWDDSQNRGITYYCGGFPEENGAYDLKGQYVYGDYLAMRICSVQMKYLEIKTPRLVKGDYNVWICWRRANPCEFTTTFKQEGYEDQVFEPNVDLQDYMSDFDGNTDTAVANGWKQYNAKAYNSVFCSKNIATISVKETGEHILRFDGAIQSRGDGNYWDMIQFIPVDEDQTWPRVAMDGTLIEKDVPADAIYPSDGTYFNENNNAYVNWWGTHERTYLTPQVELMDFKDSLFSYKSVKGEPFVRIVDYIADSSVPLDELTIPATVTYEGEEYSVAGFYYGKLGGSLNVKKLIIEEGELSHIPAKFFMNCSFTEVVMNGITSIEDYGFSGCTSLTTVTAPRLYQIGDYGFSGCKALTTLNVGKSIVLGEAALQDCESLTEIPTIDGIATKALCNCFLLKSIRFSPLVDDVLPGAIFKAIPKRLSDESYSLTDIYVENPMMDLFQLPKNNTVLNYFNATVHVTPTALAYVKGTLSDHIGSSVVDVVADETIPAIGWRYTCEEGKAKITGYRSWLTDIVVPETLNDRLTGEPLPTDLATTYAFRVTVANESTRDSIYRNMTSFTMSDCMTICPTLEARLNNFYVGSAFDGRYLGSRVLNTKNFVVSESNPYLCAVDGKVYSKDITTLIAWIKGEELSNMPASVTKLSTYSLYMYACDTLIIPEGVKEIELSAVSWGKMKVLYLPSTLTTASISSFRGNEIETDSLHTVYCANPLPIENGGGIYVGYTDDREVERINTLYVRPESVEAYKADNAWSANFVNILPYDGFAPSAIEEQLADKRVASPQLDGSGISGLEPGSIVTIYNVAGVQVKQDVVPADGRIEFVEGRNGLYLIRHAGKVYKWMGR